MRRANHPGGNVSARRRATLSDVARLAGVSPVTVSRAIRHPEMVSEDLRRRIDEAVRSLNYIPNNLASALASTRTHIVGVIVPSLTNGVFDDYLGAIQDVLNPAGFEVLVLNVRYSEIEEEKAIAALLGYHPEAMIVAGTDQTERSRELLRNAGVPVVQTMDVTDDPIDLNIGLDHRAAGAAAVRFLYELGHRKIAHLTARADPSSLPGVARATATGMPEDGWRSWEVTLAPGQEADRLLQHCTENGFSLRGFDLRKPSLHDVFLHLVGGAP